MVNLPFPFVCHREHRDYFATVQGLSLGQRTRSEAASTLTQSGGTVEYDCAHGVISAPLSPDGDGAVRAPGVHIREHGGPVRDGEPVDSVPALYLGSVRAGVLSLRVIVGADTLGPFLAERGASAQLFKCL